LTLRFDRLHMPYRLRRYTSILFNASANVIRLRLHRPHFYTPMTHPAYATLSRACALT